ncbi:hypothetical protein BJV77DRAFT_1070476 [Russula vinacea]|nr:hypothetical protein BJV77DRAFT_1070476 [Russula vinacea]
MLPLPTTTATTATTTTTTTTIHWHHHRDFGNSLPNETLSAIFDCLPRDALTRVARVSRRWRANAERSIMILVVVRTLAPDDNDDYDYDYGDDDGAAGCACHDLRCCETLFARPRLKDPLCFSFASHKHREDARPVAVHLDSLELSFGLAQHFPAPLTPPKPREPPAPPSPQAPIPPTPHTQKPHSSSSAQLPLLHLSQQYHLPLHLPPLLRLPSLRTLALNGIGTPPAPDIERLLQTHPALHHLRLSDYRGALHLTPADLPHLRSFRGYPATAASLLPGRPVQALGLVSCCELATEEHLVRIARGSVPVSALDLSGMSVTPALLRSVSRHLSQVEWLKVRLALRYALSGSIRLLTMLTTVLAAFYNLRGLDLSPTNAVVRHTASDGQQQNDAVEEQHLCITWLGACPSLRRVVFPSQTEWSLSEDGTWISGSGPRSPDSLPRSYLATPTRAR